MRILVLALLLALLFAGCSHTEDGDGGGGGSPYNEAADPEVPSEAPAALERQPESLRPRSGGF